MADGADERRIALVVREWGHQVYAIGCMELFCRHNGVSFLLPSYEPGPLAAPAAALGCKHNAPPRPPVPSCSPRSTRGFGASSTCSGGAPMVLWILGTRFSLSKPGGRRATAGRCGLPQPSRPALQAHCAQQQAALACRMHLLCGKPAVWAFGSVELLHLPCWPASTLVSVNSQVGGPLIPDLDTATAEYPNTVVKLDGSLQVAKPSLH